MENKVYIVIEKSDFLEGVFNIYKVLQCSDEKDIEDYVNYLNKNCPSNTSYHYECKDIERLLV